MEMRIPFTTSRGTDLVKDFILNEILSKDGVIGWSESVASIHPFYKEEL